jgi:hypothetical protein
MTDYYRSLDTQEYRVPTSRAYHEKLTPNPSVA